MLLYLGGALVAIALLGWLLLGSTFASMAASPNDPSAALSAFGKIFFFAIIAGTVMFAASLLVWRSGLVGGDPAADIGWSLGAGAAYVGALRDLGEGLAALHADLGERMRNVVVMTMTELGRTLKQNGSGGTDHGHASSLFLLGGPVHGGRVYGSWPGLAPEQLYEGRDLAMTTDFRSVFGEVATRHLKADDPARIFPGFAGTGRRLGVLRG